MKANLKRMGSILAVIAGLFVFVGCSGDNSLAPQMNSADDTVISYSPGSGEDSRDASPRTGIEHRLAILSSSNAPPRRRARPG